MTVPKRILIAAIIFIGLFAIVLTLWLRREPPEALTVSFGGYTNLPSGVRLAMFTVSNKSDIIVKRWAVVYVESTPFLPTNSPRNWKMDLGAYRDLLPWHLHPDVYLNPGDTERILVREIPPHGDWRVRVPWTPGRRAKTHLKLRNFPYAKLPAEWTAGEHYATSNTVEE